MKFWLLLMLLQGAVFSGLSQPYRIQGRIVDLASKVPLPFANVVINHQKNQTVSSDINGFFSYQSNQKITALSCSYIGYKNREWVLEELPLTPLVIGLEASSELLKEVAVYPGENPAWRIMKQVIAHRDRNNPERLPSFSYECYNKLVADFKLNSTHPKDSAGFAAFRNGKHLMIMENVTRRKFISPDLSDEEVIATRVSGFKNPMFASVATEIQPFSFYQEHIKLLDIHYLNPISSGSLKRYRFKIEDHYLQEKDTVFMISFEPLSGKNFDGLKGVLYIHSAHYAVQKVIAWPNHRGKINLKIQQQYQQIDGTYWFPEQLSYVLQIDAYPSPKMGLYLEGKSYIRQVQINPSLRRSDFALQRVHIAEDAPRKDTAFWQQKRTEPLRAEELKTYRFLDSVGQKYQLDRALKIVEKLTENRIELGCIDLDLSKTIQYNQYEQTRWGTGIYTNQKVSPYFWVGGFAGYGTKDQKWKYGYEAYGVLSRKKELFLGVSHQHNLAEIGTTDLRSYHSKILRWRTYLGSWFDQIHQNSLVFKYRISRFCTGITSVNRTEVKPVYPTQPMTDLVRYKHTDLRTYLRFAYREKITQVFQRNVETATTYPILYFFASKGIKNWLGGDWNYLKLQMAIEQNFYTPQIGQTSYRIESGFLDKTVPLGLQFTGEGSYDSQNPYVTKNTFQTMKPYEFASDQYLHLFLKHDFGALLFKTKYLQPGLSLYQNWGWGSARKNHLEVSGLFKNLQRVYAESGLGVNNLIKINLENLGYLGIGTAVFYRHGFYAYPDLKDNLAYKITFQLTSQ